MKRLLKWLVPALVVYVAVSLWGGGGIYGVLHPLSTACELNKQYAIGAVEGSPAFRLLNSKIISSGNPVESDKLCSTGITLSTGVDETLYYHLYELRGQTMVYAGVGAEGMQLVKDHMAQHP